MVVPSSKSPKELPIKDTSHVKHSSGMLQWIGEMTATQGTQQMFHWNFKLFPGSLGFFFFGGGWEWNTVIYLPGSWGRNCKEFIFFFPKWKRDDIAALFLNSAFF